ncbi:DUF5946 family protein [Deinococcus malanensis]|uniref:DUF5946 family protein n=1 Tax=Deinococcus malanensis TaxID=1706855 RepID=UPI0036278F5A
MAKAHVLEVLDQWLALGAEDTARTALEEASARLPHVAYNATVKVGLTLLDDVGGGWTNRHINDALRFQTAQALQTSGWVTVCLWTSDVPERAALRQLVLESAHRAAFAACHGDPHTLLGMMCQEGASAAFAERTLEFNAEELAYSRVVLAPHVESTHQPTVLAAMYGDDAARDWGYTPLGLSNQAGFQVALADALEQQAGAPRDHGCALARNVRGLRRGVAPRGGSRSSLHDLQPCLLGGIQRPRQYAVLARGRALEALLVDAYAVQHPGTPSNQAINSVAIHLMVLYGVIVRGYAPDQAQRLRQRPGQQRRVPKHERFFWLTPPSFASVLTVADVLSAADVQARADVAEAWVRDVWSVWAQLHEGQVAAWFAAYMAFE